LFSSQSRGSFGQGRSRHGASEPFRDFGYGDFRGRPLPVLTKLSNRSHPIRTRLGLAGWSYGGS